MTADRQNWLSLLATADTAELARLCDSAGIAAPHNLLRAPEIGGVMTRGRIGATGAPFNLGEVTVTRCSVRLETGEVGHGYIQGRDKAKAERVAILDALLQTGEHDRIADQILAPLCASAQQARQTRARKAAATKVDFFTVARGED